MILPEWFKPNSLVVSKYFMLVMLWNTNKQNFLNSSVNRELFPNILIYVHLNKMSMLSTNINTFLTLFAPFSFLVSILNFFWGKLRSLLSTLLIKNVPYLQNQSLCERLYNSPLNYNSVKNVWLCMFYVTSATWIFQTRTTVSSLLFHWVCDWIQGI